MYNIFRKTTFIKLHIFLVKYYDFKIIKIYDSYEKDVNILTEQIYNADNVFKTYKLFNVEETNIQCIYYETIRDGGNRIVYNWKNTILNHMF